MAVSEIVAKYPEQTKEILRYYRKKATEEEKKIIFDTTRQAAKTVKRDQQGDKKNEKKKKPAGSALPTPEVIAAALYKALSEGGGNVEGDPSQGKPTQIAGRFDLNDLARKLLSALA